MTTDTNPSQALLAEIASYSQPQTFRRAELLPNGFVRVDTRAGTVRMWERTERLMLRLRSGQPNRDSTGCAAIPVEELQAVAQLLGADPYWTESAF